MMQLSIGIHCPGFQSGFIRVFAHFGSRGQYRIHQLNPIYFSEMIRMSGCGVELNENSAKCAEQKNKNSIKQPSGIIAKMRPEHHSSEQRQVKSQQQYPELNRKRVV